MGLDMYLIRKEFIFGVDLSNLTPSEIKRNNPLFFEKVKSYMREVGENDAYAYYICGESEVGYWRKANHIHKWMVDNVQKGRDDCEPHVVSKEKLLALKHTCEMAMECFTENGVLKPRKLYLLEEILPTSGGFFFGELGYNYDYWENVQSAIRIIDKIIADTDWEDEIIYYHASW